MKHSKHLSLLIKQGQICNQIKESKYLYQVDNYHKLPVSLHNLISLGFTQQIDSNIIYLL